MHEGRMKLGPFTFSVAILKCLAINVSVVMKFSVQLSVIITSVN